MSSVHQNDNIQILLAFLLLLFLLLCCLLNQSVSSPPEENQVCLSSIAFSAWH